MRTLRPNSAGLLVSLILLFFHSNDTVRTHRRTKCTSDAFCLIGYLNGIMSFFIDFSLCKDQDFFRAGIHTESAALAKIRFESKFRHKFIHPFHIRSSYNIFAANQEKKDVRFFRITSVQASAGLLSF